jgi:hypothetical protein
MLSKKEYQNVIQIIQNAISKSISISESAQKFGYSENDFLKMQAKIEASYSKGTLDKGDWDEYSYLLSSAMDFYEQKSEKSPSEDELSDIVRNINTLSRHTKNDKDKSVAFQIGELLVRLKDLLYGSYNEFIVTYLPFSERTARTYTKTFYDMGGTYSSESENEDEIADIVERINKLSQFTKNDQDKKVSYEIGSLLVRLKDLLPGSYNEFIGTYLPFSERTARNYAKIFYNMGGTYSSEDAFEIKEDIKTYLKKEVSESNDITDTEHLISLLKPKSVDLNDDYDERSRWWMDRDSENKIIRYNYHIYIQDSPSLKGSFTCEQMEDIYKKYPYVTQNTISRDFPYITFPDFKKILRCFNITKDKLFPPHIVEDYSEDELADFALKAKESAGYKKMIEKKSEYYEKRFKDVQKSLLNAQTDRDWIESIVDKYFNENRQSSIETIRFSSIDSTNSKTNELHPRLYCFMSDLHIGKVYEHPIYGRGFNKEIAKERFEQMAFHICRDAHKYEHLTILCGGDITESIMEDGLHSGIHKYMDIFQENQIMYALDLFHSLFTTIMENTNFKSIELLGLEGNHDRIGSQRHDDKNRTAAKLFYKVLQREWKDKIDVILSDEGIINQKRENICIISHHGDANLAKKKGEEIVNLFGDGKRFYHLVIKGHFHHLECKEGTNFLSMTLPSVCSADTYSITEFAQNSQPGIILGHQAEFGLGFDFKKITLF